jgi:NADH:ubiquinone oxidoreductase subunit H
MNTICQILLFNPLRWTVLFFLIKFLLYGIGTNYFSVTLLLLSLHYLSCKLLANYQRPIGAKQSWISCLFQAIADGVKLIFKEVCPSTWH